MVTKTQARRKQDIKSKLMAAIAMLLVSSIMMVSSTYAWFTLSTAPEVTGISTAVGANGNLEMALLPKTGILNDITSGAGDSTKEIVARNVTWGNLVDLSDDTYGLDNITLFPSQLDLTTGGAVNVGGSILSTPSYGADGRIDKLVSNSVTGYYENDAFTPNDDYGVRAVGTASGMTDRQLDYRNARAAGNNARAQAANEASKSLNNNGSSLANIAIKYGMDGADAKFDQTHVASLRAIINDLQTKVLPQIEKAYMQYILAYAASAATSTPNDENDNDDLVWTAVKAIVSAENATLASVISTIESGSITIGEETITFEVTLPETLTNAVNGYASMLSAVNTASTSLDELEDDGDDAKFTWGQIRTPMEPLANPDAMKINGFLAKDVKNNLGDLVSSVTSQGGLKVTMETDHTGDTVESAGIYADIADHCGDYTASVTIDRVEYNGIVLNNMSARMETASGLDMSYLNQVGTVVETAKAPASASNVAMPITDMYGYIIDLAFRTNAADSKLLLSKKGVDRIYGDNTNEETMGSGSTMTFAATTTDFTNDQVKGLMGAIRLVFFNPINGNIHCYGKLDTANATLGADGWTAEISLYTINTTGEDSYTQVAVGTQLNPNTDYYTRDNGTDVYTPTTILANDTRELYSRIEGTDGDPTSYAKIDSASIANKEGETAYLKSVRYTYTKVNSIEGITNVTTLWTKDAVVKTEIPAVDNAVMSLTQNTATELSVLVYLDGNVVTNANVAATAATSMTGKMNLQFASSANLVPMEYADLHIAGETVEVTVPSGVTGKTTAVKGRDYTFTYNGADTVSITVGGQAIATPTPSNGSYTIPAESVTGDIVITLTSAATGDEGDQTTGE